jgi:hypothetical protein
MNPRWTPEGYALAKRKLANMEARLAALNARNDLSPVHQQEARRSYEDMIGQYRREIDQYEKREPERRKSQGPVPSRQLPQADPPMQPAE